MTAFRRFLRSEADARFNGDVVDVISLTAVLDRPHRDICVLQMPFVEVEYYPILFVALEDRVVHAF